MKNLTIITATIVLSVLACSTAWSADAREVRVGDYLLLRVRCAAGGYTIDQRVAALQQRANDLLKGGKESVTVSVRKSGLDVNIYTDDKLFTTVTSADAQANGDNAMSLAETWAQRLRTVFPKSTPDKPGVGRPDQPGNRN
jgi:hypothetical protein